ncbi:hypothetical protein AXF42_Ash007342 [Apostasia shenzhenica]|uniref:Uncharacterized protein n=1 Tax=Apostasia shenzhenica TaxID=1088818 RepID=A0A2I0B9X3_9ASPA|nr:hypothetical protein AXF42_Ash007342 [Apostasia shenzhenica]
MLTGFKKTIDSDKSTRVLDLCDWQELDDQLLVTENLQLSESHADMAISINPEKTTAVDVPTLWPTALVGSYGSLNVVADSTSRCGPNIVPGITAESYDQISWLMLYELRHRQ